MRLLWLVDVLRAAGLPVYEVAGWRDRGGSTFEPRGIVCHATAGSATSTDAGEIHVLLTGSNSAPPPIAQLYLSRTGAWHVVASGRCNHALTGQPGTPLAGVGNSGLIGVEAQNDNRGQPWPAAQVASYRRGVAAICAKMGWPVTRVVAHREHQPSGKTDPHGIDMRAFRAAVADLMNGDNMTNWEDTPLSGNPGFSGTAETAMVSAWEHAWHGRQASQRTEAAVTALRGVVDGLVAVIEAGGGSVDTAAILAGVDQRLEAMREAQEVEMRDAVADLGEGGAVQVRGPQA